MITTLYQFADLLKDEETLTVYFSPAENPFEGRENKGKVLVGEVEDGKFKGFSLEDFKPNLINQYLYRRPAGARGTNTVPTLMINRDNPEKTAGKFIQSLDNYNLKFIDRSETEKIKEGIENQNYNKDFSYLLTFRINGKYFGQYDAYVSVFNEEAYNKYFKKNYGNTRQESKICALTGQEDTVYGFVDTLGFTVDAESFRRNGFDASNAYSMFPVSQKAIPVLEGAKGILLNKLAANFYGTLRYAIMPHFVFQPKREDAEYIASKFLYKAAFNADSKDDAGSKAFVNDTEAILHEIIEDNDLNKSDIYYAIIFFEQQQAQFKIHLELSDVLPSRISQVIDAKEKAERRYKVFTTFQTKEGNIKSQRITLFRLREYFQTGDKNVQPAFYKLITSIFTGQPYDDSKLLKLVLDTWKTSFKKNFHDQENNFNYLVKYSLGNLYFLNLLGIFKKQYNMSKENQAQEKQDAFSFITRHPAYFTKEYLKGAFIFGCLVTRLLYNQPGNAFMKELNGLNIDQELITRKFPKLIAKLRQFDKAFPDLEAAALKYFAEKDKKVSKDEISFAFTMGLVLQKDFDRINKSNQNIDNDE